ncbi:MAG: YkgJ family cysteine cluster protein [bacterium]|nr:YkgJ family cysteine cluster protein [bacterium]
MPDDATDPTIDCRTDCGACCIAPSIHTPFFGMPNGKRAGERCVHLTADYACEIFGRPERPQCCADLRPSVGMCGESRAEALAILQRWERETGPE